MSQTTLLSEIDRDTDQRESLLPWSGKSNVVFLLDAANSLEEEVLRDWIATQSNGREADYAFANIADTNESSLTPVIESCLEYRQDPWLQPVRAVWLGHPSSEKRFPLIQDLFAGIVQHPGQTRGKWIRKRRPDRLKIAAGAGAHLSEVQAQFENSWGTSGVANTTLALFIVRQAAIVLERAERVLRGARYKVPRLLTTDFFADPAYQSKLAEIAGSGDGQLAQTRETAERYLKEMAATQNPFTLDCFIALQRAMYVSTYDPEIDYLPEELDQIRELLNNRPVVFLVTHKSMLDTVALSVTLFDNNLPPPMAFGGINLNTFGLGALGKNAGVIFIRRSFQDNETYKATFRRYIDYLVEKRFSFVWAFEGTRSRTGKLLPPRYGMFNYFVESILRNKSYDVTFVPVTIAYDQINEVDDYIREQKGQDKKPEGMTWIARFLRSKQKLGRIFLRFGEPLRLPDIVTPERLNDGLDQEQKTEAVQRLAFQVAVRINKVTPITATSLLTLALLANGTRARTREGIKRTIESWMEVVRRRQIPTAGKLDLDTVESIEVTLEQLMRNGVVTCYEEGLDKVYAICRGEYMRAAYYRNTIIHFFVVDALIELALMKVVDRPDEDGALIFWREIENLRDLLKFEFYFTPRDEFRQEVDAEIKARTSSWESALREGGPAAQATLNETRPLVAQGVLRSFMDAYSVVAQALCRLGSQPVTDEKAFLTDCIRLGNQMYLQSRVFAEESVSKSLFETGLKLASNRGLTEGGDDVAQRRVQWAQEMRDICRRLDIIVTMVLSRQED